MQRYEYDPAEAGEREPLDDQNYAYGRPQQQQYGYQQPQGYRQDQYPPQTQAQPQARPRPGAQAGSSFERLRAERRLSRDRSASSGSSGGQGQAPYVVGSAPAGYRQDPASSGSSHGQAPYSTGAPAGYRQGPPGGSPPRPPPHRDGDGRQWGNEMGYGQAIAQSNITPGADNFSDKVSGGGISGIAYGVAERHARESGVEATRNRALSQPRPYREPAVQPPNQAYSQQPIHGAGGGYYDPHVQSAYPPHPTNRYSNSSLTPLGAAAMPPDRNSSSRVSPQSFGSGDVYSDDPYQGYSRNTDPRLGAVDPNDIEDDGDEGLEYRRPARTSMLSLHSDRSRNNNHGTTAAAAVAGGVAAGGVIGKIGGLVGRSGNGAASAKYGPVQGGNNLAYHGAGSEIDLGQEKPSDWLSKQKTGRKKWTWAIIIGLIIVTAAGIGLGLYFGYFAKKNSGGLSAAADTSENGDLNINSGEIQALLNNKNLHKVFPGIDYTPINTQYPDCLSDPPSQNNVTRDVAVLSQLTNTIRLYGTDCNQTEMVLHAISQLKMTSTLKVWMGVWQDNNVTTNARQLAQMYDILDKYGASQFKGVIVANEILFRQQMTVTELGDLLSEVRTNLTSKGYGLPVATSDLGDNWTAELAEQSDYIMANIHPFFGGVNAQQAADWTYSFWEDHSASFFKSDPTKNVISETGWPSQGGTDCGTTSVTDCPNAAVAGISQMNTFMSDWVCNAIANGTQYFWFEAFDEPWKIQFDTPGQAWEDHWGLMDVNRNLKSGVQVPDCGGKTVS